MWFTAFSFLRQGFGNKPSIYFARKHLTNLDAHLRHQFNSTHSLF
jgi:hypothetical protein